MIGLFFPGGCLATRKAIFTWSGLPRANKPRSPPGRARSLGAPARCAADAPARLARTVSLRVTAAYVRGMGSVNRVALADQAYRDALAAARAESSPHTWRRLVRAAQNLRDAQPNGAGASRGGHVRPGPSVLLVEDDAATRDALRDILCEQRIRVWTAPDGRAALELLRSGRITPSVIVMDLMLPRMSGF